MGRSIQVYARARILQIARCLRGAFVRVVLICPRLDLASHEKRLLPQMQDRQMRNMRRNVCSLENLTFNRSATNVCNQPKAASHLSLHTFAI